MQSELLDIASDNMPGATLGVTYLPAHLRMVMVRGKGSHIYDQSGKEYIDYLLGSGPLLLGHCHPAVVEAVKAQVELSSTFYLLNEPAIRLAQKIVTAAPCGEALRYQLGGTEATYAALRIARAATGRNLILKFEGGFHGAHDIAQVSVDVWLNRKIPFGVRDTSGIPPSIVNEVLVAQFNDLDSVKAIVNEFGDDIAAIIVEPIQRVLLPQPGFLGGLRSLSKEKGILLIFDEIVTGFRVAWGGAQELYGVTPDLACYGKAIGGGYPIAAVVGRRDLLEYADPSRRGKDTYCYLGGTFGGNPISAAAGLAALTILEEPGAIKRLRDTGDALRRGLQAVGERSGLPLRVLGEGPVLQVVFSERTEFSNAKHLSQIDHSLTLRFGLEMIARGIIFTPKSKMYVSLVHTENDLDRTFDAAAKVLRQIAL